MPIHYSCLAASILAAGMGQIAIKGGATGTETFFEQCVNPLTIIGLFTYVLAAAGYLVAIRGIPVSIAFPSVSASYILVGIAAHFLWNEPFGFKQLIAVAFIGVGIVLLHLPSSAA